MVPFSFENVARSAGLDASKAYPLSEAARTAHESFESHLQHAIAPQRDLPARPSARDDKESQEPADRTSGVPQDTEQIRDDAGETQPDEAGVYQADASESTARSEKSQENSDDDAQRDTTLKDEIVIASTAETRSVALESIVQKAPGDANETTDKVVVEDPVNASLSVEEPEPDAVIASGVAGSPGDELIPSGDVVPAGGNVEGGSSEPQKIVDSNNRPELVKPPETSENIATDEFPEETPVTEATVQKDEPAQTSITRRPLAGRDNASVNDALDDTSDVATKPVAVDAVQAAANAAGEEDLGQRQSRHDKEGRPPTGNVTAADVTSTTSGTPSRFTQHLLASVESPHAGGVNITEADQARFVDRVARAMQATGDRGGTLRLRLSPPELGSLTLEVKVQGGAVTARVEADTPAARSLLLENVPLLRERLAEQGMRVEQFDVDLSDRDSGGTPDGLQQHDHPQDGHTRSKATSREPDVASPETSSESPTQNGNEQLNIIV